MWKDIKDACKDEKTVSQDGLQSVNPSFKVKTHHTRVRAHTHFPCACISLKEHSGVIILNVYFLLKD